MPQPSFTDYAVNKRFPEGDDADTTDDMAGADDTAVAEPTPADMEGLVGELSEAAAAGVPPEADAVGGDMPAEGGGDVEALAAALQVDVPHAAKLFEAAQEIPALSGLSGDELAAELSGNNTMRFELERRATKLGGPEEEMVEPPVDDAEAEMPPGL